MPPLDRLTVTFTLGARDVRHLRRVAEHAAAGASERPELAIRAAARARAEEVRKFRPPEYVLDRVVALEQLIELLDDADWQPPPRVRERVRAVEARRRCRSDLGGADTAVQAGPPRQAISLR